MDNICSLDESVLWCPVPWCSVRSVQKGSFPLGVKSITEFLSTCFLMIATIEHFCFVFHKIKYYNILYIQHTHGCHLT